MLRAGAACSACFGLVIEYSSSLEVAVLRGTQPYGQGENDSDEIAQARHERQPMGE